MLTPTKLSVYLSDCHRERPGLIRASTLSFDLRESCGQIADALPDNRPGRIDLECSDAFIEALRAIVKGDDCLLEAPNDRLAVGFDRLTSAGLEGGRIRFHYGQVDEVAAERRRVCPAVIIGEQLACDLVSARQGPYPADFILWQGSVEVDAAFTDDFELDRSSCDEYRRPDPVAIDKGRSTQLQ